VDLQPVRVQRRYERLDGGPQHDEIGAQQHDQHQGHDQTQRPYGRPAQHEDHPADRAHERDRDDELVHVAPRHPTGRDASRDESGGV
jgi:hypothetical protein